jgi:apolipoprotein N-acyltransferase
VSGPDRRWMTLAAGSGLSVLLIGLSFAPLAWYSLAWIALAPVLVSLARRPGRIGWLILWAAGLAWGCVTFWYMRHVTFLGVLLLGFYLSWYFVVFCLSVRWLSFEKGIPLSLAAPLVWTALECIRGVLFTGFPFHFLAHSQYQALGVIQIADLTGAAGVTFWLVSVSGLAADIACRIRRFPTKVSRLSALVGGVVVIIISVSALLYGRHRLDSLVVREGPRIAVVQGNIPQDAKNLATYETFDEMLKVHVALTEKALAAHPKPDLVIWPETMAPPGVFDRYGHNLIKLWLDSNLAERHEPIWQSRFDYWQRYERWYTAFLPLQKHADLLISANAYPEPSHPDIIYNSAFLLPQSGEGTVGRYDKIHLVPFGEYVPLKSAIGWLIGPLVPYKTGLTPGSEFKVFEIDGWAYAPTICFEDAFPRLVAEFGILERLDFIVNITNEGWFKDGTELDEHLAVGVFRAVENRKGLVRAANTGISAFISPTGEVLSKLVVEGRDREVAGVLHGRATTAVGRSPYYITGEFFAEFCAGFWVLLALIQCVEGVVRRWRSRRGNRQ